jgi:hypothetical protein
VNAPKDSRCQFAAPGSVQAKGPQLLEIVIDFCDDLLRIGDELELGFVHLAKEL